ncbi:MAG: hypothetical protein IPN17_20420 [Deltaproteobacteria bacterium]|nr:hypothetical protein [Deltaproteobacteria bacterium]
MDHRRLVIAPAIVIALAAVGAALVATRRPAPPAPPRRSAAVARPPAPRIARTVAAPERAVLPATLRELSARLDARYALRPDARFALALQHLASLETPAAPAPELRPSRDGWSVLVRGAPVSTLPRDVTFDAMLTAAVAFATERDLPTRVQLAHEPPPRSDALAAPMLRDPWAAARAADARWIAGAHRVSDIVALGRALALTAALSRDPLGLGDAVAARSLSALALARAAGSPDPLGEALLCHAMSYTAEAAGRFEALATTHRDAVARVLLAAREGAVVPRTDLAGARRAAQDIPGQVLTSLERDEDDVGRGRGGLRALLGAGDRGGHRRRLDRSVGDGVAAAVSLGRRADAGALRGAAGGLDPVAGAGGAGAAGQPLRPVGRRVALLGEAVHRRVGERLGEGDAGAGRGRGRGRRDPRGAAQPAGAGGRRRGRYDRGDVGHRAPSAADGPAPCAPPRAGLAADRRRVRCPEGGGDAGRRGGAGAGLRRGGGRPAGGDPRRPRGLLALARTGSPAGRVAALRPLARTPGPDSAQQDAAWQALIEESGGDGELMAQWGMALIARGEASRARDTLTAWASSNRRASSAAQVAVAAALGEALLRLRDLPGAWRVLEPWATSDSVPALSAGARALIELERFEEAERLARRAWDRDEHAPTTALLAEACWRRSNHAAAAEALSSRAGAMSEPTWEETVGQSFDAVFSGRSPAEGRAALAALGPEVDVLRRSALLRAMLRAGHGGIAAQIHESLRAEGDAHRELLLARYAMRVASEGELPAGEWLQGEVPGPERVELADAAYARRLGEVLWGVVDAPPGGPAGDRVWLLRAATSLREGASDPHRPELLEHLRASDNGGWAHTLARHLMDLSPMEAVRAQADTREQEWQTAYYLGLKALAAGDRAAASDWLHGALDPGEGAPVEARWALAALREEASGDRGLALRVEAE